jgi:hypothetical protein
VNRETARLFEGVLLDSLEAVELVAQQEFQGQVLEAVHQALPAPLTEHCRLSLFLWAWASEP